MRNLKRIIILIVVCCLCSPAYSQTEIDSLLAALKRAKHDTTRCEILNQLVETEVDDNIWPKYNIRMKIMAMQNLRKHKNDKRLTKVYKRYLAAAINNIGYLYSLKGDMLHALNYYHECLDIQREINDKMGIATSLNNIGSIYNDQDDADMAYDYYQRSYKIQQEINDKSGMAVSLINIGYYFDGREENEKALDYYTKSLALSVEIDDQPGQVYTMNNMGLSFLELKDNKKALEYFDKALAIAEAIGYKEGISHSLYCYGVIYSSEGKYALALEKTLKSLDIANDLGFVQRIRDAYDKLHKIYKYMGQYQKALDMHEMFISVRDSLTNEQTKKMSLKRQFKNEYEKKAAADKILAAEERKVSDARLAESHAKLKQQRTERFALYGGLVLVVLFAAFVFQRYRVSRKQQKLIELKEKEAQIQKALVEVKQKEIIDSIHYAKQIQMALLPQGGTIEKMLKRLKAKSKNAEVRIEK